MASPQSGAAISRILKSLLKMLNYHWYGSYGTLEQACITWQTPRQRARLSTPGMQNPTPDGRNSTPGYDVTDIEKCDIL